MSMVANVKAESNTINYGKSRDWGTKLGHVTPKVSPDELVAAIMMCDNDKATGILSKYGFQAIPGLEMVTGQMAADFFGVEYSAFKNMVRRALPGVYGPDRQTHRAGYIIDELQHSGVRYGYVEIPKVFKITVCDPEGGICINFAVPRQGSVCLLSPRMVLALAVILVTGRVKTGNTTLNTVNALIASDYVDVAEKIHDDRIRATVERMRREAKDVHLSASREVSEEFVPEVSESAVEAPAASEKVEDDDMAKVLERVIKAMEASDKRPESKEIDYLKTLATMFSSMTAMAVTSFFKSIMVGSMKEVMKEIMAEMVTTK